MEPTKLLTEKQVNEIYGFNIGGLRVKRNRGGGFPFVKISGKIYYRMKDIESFIEKHLYTSTSEYTLKQS